MFGSVGVYSLYGLFNVALTRAIAWVTRAPQLHTADTHARGPSPGETFLRQSVVVASPVVLAGEGVPLSAAEFKSSIDSPALSQSNESGAAGSDTRLSSCWGLRDFLEEFSRRAHPSRRSGN